MKRLLTVFLTTLLVFALAACKTNEPNSDISENIEPTSQATTTTDSSTAMIITTTITTTSRRPSSVTTTATTTGSMTKNDYRPTPVAAQTLANSHYLLTQKKAFNVAYYGGSITQGAGASDEESTSWRALTTAWLKSAYPDANIAEIEAARGGTGTYYGKMRADSELLKHNPDLVFIEFVVNDNIEHKTSEQSKENLEIILRKCYQHNPNMDIVFIYTCTVGTGATNTYTKAFDEVANHYGLPTINVGKALTKAGGKLTDYFIDDQVHPNDKGYRIMADEVIAQMTAMLAAAGSPKSLTAHQNPQPLKESLSLNVSVYNSGNILAQNPTLKTQTPNTYCEVDSALLTKGNTVTFAFKGTSVGVWWRCFDRSTIVHCQLDGQQTATKVLHNGTYYTYELFDNLENAEHTLTITYNGDTALYLPYILVTY